LQLFAIFITGIYGQDFAIIYPILTHCFLPIHWIMNLGLQDGFLFSVPSARSLPVRCRDAEH